MYVCVLIQVFVNDAPFTARFNRHMRAATHAPVYFGQVPAAEWTMPASVDVDEAEDAWEVMHVQNVLYAQSKSYRQMCRYQSGFLMNHPLMRTRGESFIGKGGRVLFWRRRYVPALIQATATPLSSTARWPGQAGVHACPKTRSVRRTANQGGSTTKATR